MYSLSHIKSVGFAAAVLVAMHMSGSARADDFVENLGPNEPIITEVGHKRVVAFQTSGDSQCTFHAVVWDTRDEDAATSAARVRVGLEPGQIVHIDTAESKTLNIQCDDEAKTLSVVDNDERVAFALTSQNSNQMMKANASDF